MKKNSKTLFVYLAFTIITLSTCQLLEKEDDRKSLKDFSLDTAADVNKDSIKNSPSMLEKQLKNAGLVDVQQVETTIKVELRYSTTNNFLKKDVYGELNKAYLQKDVAEKLKLAQMFLKSKFPSYSLLIYDAVRPRSIQQKMWKALDMPSKEKVKYLSNPRNGSLHNFGAAVDLTIVNQYQEPLDMGTDFDHFGELAYPIKEKELVEKGELTNNQVNNRKLLREVMQKAGFFNIQTEWWHFNSCYRNEARRKYSIIE